MTLLSNRSLLHVAGDRSYQIQAEEVFKLISQRLLRLGRDFAAGIDMRVIEQEHDWLTLGRLDEPVAHRDMRLPWMLTDKVRNQAVLVYELGCELLHLIGDEGVPLADELMFVIRHMLVPGETEDSWEQWRTGYEVIYHGTRLYLPASSDQLLDDVKPDAQGSTSLIWSVLCSKLYDQLNEVLDNTKMPPRP